MFLSIIIPVYNTPIEYFVRCINSIVSTMQNDTEIIVIDDGSVDSLSYEYVERCENKKNILYKKKLNEGVSIARNYGMNFANGEYIAFVDADDIVTDSFITQSCSLAKQYGTDLILGSIEYCPYIETNQYVGSDVLVYNENNFRKIKLAYLKSLVGNKMKQDTFSILGTPCGKLYKKSLLEIVKFPEGITHWEDQIFIRNCLSKAKSAVVVSNIWYLYFQNDFSAFHSDFASKYLLKSYDFWNAWNECNQKEEDIELLKYYYMRDLRWFYLAVENAIFPLKCSNKVKKNQIKDLYGIPLFNNLLNGLSTRDFYRYSDKFKFLFFKFRAIYIILLLYWIKYLKSGNVDENKI